MASLKLYGAGWCSITQVVRNHLRRSGVEHNYVDVDEDPDAVVDALVHSEQEQRQPEVAGGGTTAPGESSATGASTSSSSEPRSDTQSLEGSPSPRARSMLPER